MLRSLFDNFWDRNRDGQVTWGETLSGVMTLCAYVIGVVLMIATWPRSLHLLSSSYFNPNIFAWWPYVAASAPEIGILFSWGACDVGLRKGNVALVAAGVVGFALFFFVVGTMQIYDVELVRGSDLAHVGKLGEFVASVVPLFTIGYLMALTSIVSAMEGASSTGSVIRIPKPQGYDKSRRPLPFPKPPRPEIDNGDEDAELRPVPATRQPSPRPLSDPLGRGPAQPNAQRGNGRDTANFPLRQP